VRVFVDSNVVMYAAGAPHPNKVPCLGFLQSAQRGDIQAVTSAEVLQEVLHRYHRLGMPEVAGEVYDLTVQICAEVFPVTLADTDTCAAILAASGGSVRDALHAAVMRNNEVDTIATFDARFQDYDVTLWPLRP
jgi:predicted nucleic acid-binding protein